MTGPTRDPDRALTPVRTALLDAARADADRVLGAAEAQARAAEDEAAARAAVILDEARRKGAADGAERVAAARTAARREARALLLAAQRSAYEQLRAAAVTAVAARLGAAAERHRLEALLTDALGPRTRIEEDPAGGLSGTAPDGRHVDASAVRLVDLALADVDVEGLWAP